MQVITKIPSKRGSVDPHYKVRPLAPAKSPIDVGANLRRLRKQQNYSLEALSHHSGVSRAMLGQIETGRSVPTVTLIWKIADALGVPVTALIESNRSPQTVVLPAARARLTTLSHGKFILRAFAAPEMAFETQFYELKIAAGHRERVEAYPPGARASLAIAKGILKFALRDAEPANLREGDAVLFEADIEQQYFNPGPHDTVAYLVIGASRNASQQR